MLRRLLGTILIVLGLAAAGLGVASATVWRESDSVVATASPQGDGTLVVTDPGVLELIGSDVTVVATVPDGGKVTVAIGRDIDVDGWIGIDHYTRVSGLADWDTLTSAAVEPELPEAAEGEEPPTPGVGANPAGNDMWVAEATGEGTTTLRWTDRPGRWSLLAAGVGEGAQAPAVELTWPREPATPWLWPAVGAGAALLVAGLLVLLLRRGARRPETADGLAPTPADSASRADAPAKRGTRSQDLTDSGTIGAHAAPTLTRRRRATSTQARDVAPTTPVTEASQRADGHGADGQRADLPGTREGQGDAGPADHVSGPVGTGGTDESGATAGAGVSAVTGPENDGAGTETAQRPARPALMSRRSRRHAASEQIGAGDHETAEANAGQSQPGTLAGAAPTSDVVGSQPAASPGRRRAFPPIFGGAAAQQPAPPSQASAPEPEAAERAAQRRHPTESAAEAASATPAPTATGSMPLPTRRELRAQEEARRAAEQTGIAGRLRALTGSIPVVRSAAPEPSAQERGDLPTRASRSQTWREVWGFDPDADNQGATDDDTKGGTR